MPLILPPPQQNPGIAGQIGQNVLAFLQTRLALQQEQKKHQQEQEDRDLAQKMLKLQMDRLKVEKLNAERDAQQRQAKNQIDALTGAPAPVGDVSNGVMGVRGGEMPDLFKRFEIASGNIPDIIPRLDTTGMQAIGRHPLIAMPGAEGAAPVMVRPPSREELMATAQQKAQLDLANLFNKTTVETTARRQAEAANPVNTTKNVQVFDPEIADFLKVKVGDSVPPEAVTQAEQNLTRSKQGRAEQYKPVVFTDTNTGQTVSRDAVTGRLLWQTNPGEVRPGQGRMTGAFRESVIGKADAIRSLDIAGEVLSDPEVVNFSGPVAGRLTLAAVAAGGYGIPPKVQRAATEIQRLIATQAFAFGGKTLTPTELNTYTKILPALTDSFPQAYQKYMQARGYLTTSLKNSLATATPEERTTLRGTDQGKIILELAGVGTANAPTKNPFRNK